MENFKDTVTAWSKMAAIGARPIAESVGIDREFYARVLNKRRNLPEADAVALGEAMGLTQDGFEQFVIQSNLCRQLEDLQAVEKLGFKATYLAQIVTPKEDRGGSSLQKYIAVYFSNVLTSRISIVRMATEKWERLNNRVDLVKLPKVYIDTAVISLLNNISVKITPDDYVSFENLLEKKDEGTKIWLQDKLEEVVSKQDLHISSFNKVRRLQRNTFLSRVIEKNTSLAHWPEAAKEFAKSHVLSPLVGEFEPVMAVAKREDEKRVFVYMTVIDDEDRFVITPQLKGNVDHFLIFLTKPYNKKKNELIFDGPASNLTWEKVNAPNSQSNEKSDEFTALEICLLNKDVRPEEKVKKRDEDLFISKKSKEHIDKKIDELDKLSNEAEAKRLAIDELLTSEERLAQEKRLVLKERKKRVAKAGALANRIESAMGTIEDDASNNKPSSNPLPF